MRISKSLRFLHVRTTTRVWRHANIPLSSWEGTNYPQADVRITPKGSTNYPASVTHDTVNMSGSVNKRKKDVHGAEDALNFTK